jgi:MerR family transcriptional regulator, light-induced transcriptional regulator
MYTIKEAAARTGVPVPLLRAWERRYGVVTPTRTAGGYRLYDDRALERLKSMRRLVDEGWTASVAAAAILDGSAPAAPTAAASDPAVPAERPAASDASRRELLEPFVDAAISLDAAALEAVLDRMLATGSFEAVADAILLPALEAVGDAWADGRLSVAGEHAASHAVLRRLAAAFQAAGRPASVRGSVLVGLPPGSRHELGALAFAVAARRAGLPILYLGPDLPVADWIATANRARARAVVIGSPTAADVGPAAAVAAGLAERAEPLLIAFGGRMAEVAADAASVDGAFVRARPLVLPDRLVDAVDALRAALPGARGQGARHSS